MIKLAPEFTDVLPLYVLIPDKVCAPDSTIRPPNPLITPEKFPVALVKLNELLPRAIEPPPEIPPKDKLPPELAKLSEPLTAT